MDQHLLIQVLLLLGTAVTVVVVFHRLHLPSSLGYLLVGVLLGPHTAGPVVESEPIRGLAEFGIVFLLFTIGLSYSLPQLNALRHQVLGLGTGQVALTTLAVGALAWAGGLPVEAAFVLGAVFAQSSTTIISKQLAEQGEEDGRHGRLGVALSVFQDVTAVPFVIVIPVLGAAGAAEALPGALAWALAKAVLAFLVVFVAGRWLLRPLFHMVAARRSAELFTLTVLFVSLMAGWATNALGLSMAFGAFLAGMALGETEFRHQVESAIRPFRDVLLGLFFIGIGMLFDPMAIGEIWYLGLAGAAVLLIVKVLLVARLVQWAGIDPVTAWRVGLLLAVGGEFGFALLAIALDAGVIGERLGQVALASVLFSMIAAPFLIRHNRVFAGRLANWQPIAREVEAPLAKVEAPAGLVDHVVICGYGRIGQSVGHLLEEEGIPYVALDLDASRVKEASKAGEPVFYGDAAERDILEAVRVMTARLVVVSHEDVAAAKKVLHHVRTIRPNLPVMVRTRDETHVQDLRDAGATEVVPETLEAGLMIASHTLVLLGVPLPRVMRRMQEQRIGRYRLLREFFRGNELGNGEERWADRLRAVQIPAESAAIGRSLEDVVPSAVVVTAVVREGERRLAPASDTEIVQGDVLVLFGAPEDLQSAEEALRSFKLDVGGPQTSITSPS